MTLRHPPVLFDEPLRPRGRAWWWLLAICVVTVFTLSVYLVPIAIIAWFVNVGRYSKTRVRVDSERIWVGRRSLPLSALDLDRIGRATNPWPWRVLNPRYLGGNPIWTRDSVGIRGRDGKKKYWVSVGTNRRDELIATLHMAVTAAKQRRQAAIAAYAGQRLPPAGWYDDPWDASQIRWWDGEQWTGYAAPHPRGGVPS
jgi:uncharacterized membrane protein YhaH (DUF805 family)